MTFQLHQKVKVKIDSTEVFNDVKWKPFWTRGVIVEENGWRILVCFKIHGALRCQWFWKEDWEDFSYEPHPYQGWWCGDFFPSLGPLRVYVPERQTPLKKQKKNKRS